MKPLDPATGLAERVYTAVLDDILDGALPAGTHLVQEHLASSLRVSRQPVQQAMALLKADGLVEEIGTRGVRVAALDLGRMQNHYDLRAVLDGYGARRAAARVQSGAVTAAKFKAQAKKILAAGVSAIRRGTVRDQIRQDEALHKLIYDASGNSTLEATAEPHWRFLRRAMADVLRHAAPPKTIWDQHSEIVEAIVTGDADLAGTLAEAHANVAATSLSDALRLRDARTRPAAENQP